MLLRPRLVESLLGPKPDEAAWIEAADFLQERLETRYFAPIATLQQDRHRDGAGFSIAALLCTLTEFVASCWEGKVYSRHAVRGLHSYMDSRRIFTSFLAIRPELASIGPDGHKKSRKKRAHDFYDNVRCPLLHEASTRGRWLIRRTGSGPIVVDDGEWKILNASAFERALRASVNAFMLDVKSGKNLERRAALLRRIDAIAGVERPLVFAYGRNLLQAELDRVGVRVHSWTRATLPGYRLAFDKLSKDGTGKANVRQEEGCEVVGACLEVEPEDVARLDRKEGAGYRRESMRLRLQPAGSTRELKTEAWVFVAKRESRVVRPPSPQYLKDVLLGMEERGLARESIDTVEKEGRS
jgi:gamma-glutamylcyclotransferase (GGCT)/AIG2-like uncharacterized protein YtfP